MFSLGIDIGGTNIKAAVVTRQGEILGSAILETDAHSGFDAVIRQICRAAEQASAESQIPLSYIRKAGLAIPGPIGNKKGPVLFAPNINWYQTDPVKPLEEKWNMPVYLGNDADCMALAENMCGAGIPFRSFLMLTLGTAVGGALIHEGKLFTGFGPYGGELGHIPLCHGGYPCSCGVKGCFEQYGSAEALKRLAREAMEKAPDSSLWDLCGHNLCDIQPSHVFSAAVLQDKTAVSVLDEFTEYLCEGMAGLVNIFRPEAVILGGGLSNAGAALFDLVNEKLPRLTYASEFIPAPPVIQAQSCTLSGAIGAALLE